MVGRSGPGFGRDESYREITSEQVPEEKKLDKFDVLSVADIFAAAIENVYLDKPMSKLYD